MPALHPTNTHRMTIAGMAILSSVVLSACATPNVAPAGFLQSYDGLRASDETGAVRMSTSSADVLAGYTSIIVEDATLIEERLSAEQEGAVRRALDTALREALSRDRQLAQMPGPNTLRVRYAIVEVETSNVALNAATSLIIGAVDYGSLALEAEIVDSETVEQRAALTWARAAKATNVLGAYSSTGNARALAPDFARRLAMLISPAAPS